MKYSLLQNFFFIVAFNFVAQSQNPLIIDVESGIINHKELNLTEISDDVTYVSLETSDECLIGYIDKIAFSGEDIFIETISPGKLLRFNNKGEFVNTIGKKGNGPNEYATLGSFCLNSAESDIYIYSVDPSKILIFDYEGKLKDQITINKNRVDHFSNIEFIPLSRHFILMQANGFGNTPFSYHIYQTKFELIKKLIKPVHFEMNGSYSRNKEFSYYVFNDELFVKENLLNDTVYRVLPTLNFKPAYIFESGKYRCPVKLRQNFMKFFMETDMKFVQLNNIYDCKNYLLFLFVFEKYY